MSATPTPDRGTMICSILALRSAVSQLRSVADYLEKLIPSTDWNFAPKATKKKAMTKKGDA